MKRVIYKITLSSTKKSYIGQASTVARRVFKHMEDLQLGVHHNKQLQKDFNSYGGTLEIEVLEELNVTDLKQASEKEFQWMIKEKTYLPGVGYNNRDPHVWDFKSNQYTKRMKEVL